MTAVTPALPNGWPGGRNIEAALLVLERMGLSPADLVSCPRDRPTVPTFAEHVPVVSDAVTAAPAVPMGRTGTASSSTGVFVGWDEPRPSEIRQLMAYVRTSRGGAAQRAWRT